MTTQNEMINSVDAINTLSKFANNSVLGRQRQVELMICAILSNNHVLIEDSPGMGKTTLAKTIGVLFGLEFNRVQFTNDLLPSDILGYNYFSKKDSTFVFQKGPIFSHLLLADEINRGTPKTQSAFLQAMEERVVTIEGKTHDLGDNFVVIATQNPSDQVGVFELPESQLDRFAIAFTMGRMNKDLERSILLQDHSSQIQLKNIFNIEEVKKLCTLKSHVTIKENVLELILNLSQIVRDHHDCHISVRPAIALREMAKARAFINKRDYVTPDDIMIIAPYIYAHRLMNGESIERNIEKVQNLFEKVTLPV